MKRIIGLGGLSYFVIGLATVIFGTLLSELLQEYNRSFSSGGSLVFAQFAGFLGGVLLAPHGARRLGYRRVISLSFAGLFLAHTVLFFRPSWSVLFIPAALNGFSFGMAQTAIGTMLLEAQDNKKAVTMSRLEVSFGIGAFVMPLISSFFLRNSNGAGPFAIVALCALALAILWSRMPLDREAALGSKKKSDADVPALPGKKRIRLYPLVFLMIYVFLYVGLETSVINFLPSVLAHRLHLESSQAALAVSVFWISMIIGRLFSGVTAERISYFTYLLISTSGALLLLIGFAVFHPKWMVFTLVFLIGLFLSGIFAIAIVYANSKNPDTTKQTTSIIIASGGIGGAVLPLLIGWSMDAIQPDAAIWLLTGFAALMILFLLRAGTARSAKRQ
ncbi:MFS transporter [Gorillibacterium timonense]|uniref:MFS transporter n=1 Tax=Gorillibacterium timonense TaxID=1689269 RepID=UPI00071C9795|nr:MFS transporter [Gorillibacterium timonense]